MYWPCSLSIMQELHVTDWLKHHSLIQGRYKTLAFKCLRQGYSATLPTPCTHPLTPPTELDTKKKLASYPHLLHGAQTLPSKPRGSASWPKETFGCKGRTIPSRFQLCNTTIYWYWCVTATTSCCLNLPACQW